MVQLSNLSKASILILVTITATVTVTVEAAKSGFADFLGIGPNDVPLINGTIVNNDNKTYGILITPAGNGSVVIPPINDTQPPVVNNTPPVVNDTTPPIQTTCTGPNEVWSAEEERCVCKEGFSEDNTEACVPIPPPIVAKDIKIAIVGDVADSSSGNLVFQQIKKQNTDYVFVLGDLGYGSSLKWFKSTYGSLGDKTWCVVGNHEANNEDGSASLETETLQFCGNSYWLKFGVNLFLMYNTNDNQNTLITATGKVLSNSTIMNGVKNIHVNGHKGCAVPPNSHHPAGEIKALCDYLKSQIPSNIKVWYNSAHNHVYSESADKTYKQSGAGGKGHYTCPTAITTAWYCNNSNYGFMLYDIKADGTITSQFIDYNGVVKK